MGCRNPSRLGSHPPPARPLLNPCDGHCPQRRAQNVRWRIPRASSVISYFRLGADSCAPGLQRKRQIHAAPPHRRHHALRYGGDHRRRHPPDSKNQPRIAEKIGYVIQEGGLFPHLTAAGNVSLKSELLGKPPQQIQSRIRELSALVGIAPSLLKRFPGS